MIHPSLQHTTHRPWKLPRTPWVMAQTWGNLLFAHWRVPIEELRRQIPQPLEIDTFEGEAWIGVVPFELRIRPRFCPVVPRIASFPEINVRTYVTYEGKPGVWFFSLDATSAVAVRAARWSFNLPYFDARMRCEDQGDQITYSSARLEENAAFNAGYEPISETWFAEPDSLAAWLTERYCLYAASRSGMISRTEVHHAQWPLQDAKAEITTNSMTEPIGIALDGQPLLHFAKHISVVNWSPRRVCRATT